MNLRTVLLITAAGLAVAAPAADAQVREMRYLGSLTGSQTTTWNEPRHPSAATDDCYHTLFDAGRGEETWKFSQSTPTKVLVTRIGTGKDVSVHYGNWNPHSMGQKGIVVSSQQSRSFERVFEEQPGECGGQSKTTVDDGVDCGNVGANSYGTLSFRDGRLKIGLIHDDLYRECPLETPEPVMAGFFTEVGPKMDGAELLDPKQKLHIILGNDTFTESRHVPDQGTLTATTTVQWQLRLKRVK